MAIFSELEAHLKPYMNRQQIRLVRRAYQLAEKAHAEQTRSSGEAYITHPVAVAKILASYRLDAETVASAILHDVIEDTEVSKTDITNEFGKEVAELVDGVSKLTQFDFKTKAEAQAANFRKMMMAVARDIRVILIKLADRLHNMRTLDHLQPQKRHRIAKETLEIYAPIANRLGIRSFRDEFQRLGFKALYPLRYKILQQSVRKARGNRREVIKSIEISLNRSLREVGVTKFELFGREKNLYGIYQKMREKRLRLSEVMDVYGFRVVVNSVDLCYRVLGAVHNLYKPVPERFKDYIAIPKANGYQSLHTTLFGPYGLPIEIQIRTTQMDQIAENGIAAHWMYKNKTSGATEAQMRARQWIKGVLELQQSAGNSIEFVENVKIDLFPDEVYVFTPDGDIFELPAGATPVDFAYAVHSDIGSSCIAVKIDKRLSPLSVALKSGQRIEIVTAPGARPNPAWLNFVATGKARSNIRHFLKKQQQEESIELGKRMLEQALLQYSLTMEQVLPEYLEAALKFVNCEVVDDLYESIGMGNQMAPIVAQQLSGQKVELDKLLSQKEALSIKGTEGMAVQFAKCCYPVPGDQIVGVLTSGRGIVVHSEECGTLQTVLHNHSDKCMPLRWEKQLEKQFEVPVMVELFQRREALAALTAAIAGAESSIHNITIQERDARFLKVYLLITVDGRTHLARVIRRVRHIKEAYKIYRLKEVSIKNEASHING